MSNPFCACFPGTRRWNGYGTCLHCGGAYEARGRLAPIVIPPTVRVFDGDAEATPTTRERGKS